MKNIRVSTKTIMGVLTALTALWQVQEVRDFVIGSVHSHPHISSVVGFIGSILALLHNPQVQQALGLEEKENQ